MCRLTETRALSAQGENRALVGNLTMPVRLVTDKLGSYRVAHRDLMPLVTP